MPINATQNAPTWNGAGLQETEAYIAARRGQSLGERPLTYPQLRALFDQDYQLPQADRQNPQFINGVGTLLSAMLDEHLFQAIDKLDGKHDYKVTKQGLQALAGQGGQKDRIEQVDISHLMGTFYQTSGF